MEEMQALREAVENVNTNYNKILPWFVVSGEELEYPLRLSQEEQRQLLAFAETARTSVVKLNESFYRTFTFALELDARLQLAERRHQIIKQEMTLMVGY